MSRLRQFALFPPLFLGAFLLFHAAAVHAGQHQSLQGWLSAIWVDAREGAPPGPDLEFWLTKQDGAAVRLEVARAQEARLLRLDRQFVRVRGEHAPPAQAQPGRAPPPRAFRVSDAQAAGGDGAAAEPIAPYYSPSLGKQPWINVLCKFADLADHEPRDLSYFTSMFASTRPGLDYYFKEISNSQLSVSGSSAAGWYTLPHPRSYYVTDSGGLAHHQLMLDCTAAADADVYFPDYSGINLVFNGSLGCCSWGGASHVDRDGILRTYGMTWMADWGWQNHTVYAHEMGHGMGLPHSRGNNQTYRNLWDVMSDIWYACYLHSDELLGCLGQHTIAYHKDRLGWIPDAARYVASVGSRASIAIDKLERPSPGTYQMAQIPIRGNPDHYYTVEVRRKYSFDRRLPGTSVVIHEVDTWRGEPANVVDGDNDGDPYDDGTRWLIGETFADRRRGIDVSVDSSDGAAGFIVTIENRDGYLFSDQFDDGDLSRWSGKLDGGDVSVSTDAAQGGTWGLQVVIDDNNQAHVTDHTPAAVASYYAKLHFNPNGIQMADGDRFTIVGAYSEGPLVGVIELRRANGWPEVRGVTRLDDGGHLYGPWTPIVDRAWHTLELEWGAASASGAHDGWFSLLVNGARAMDYAALDNDTLRIERTFLGAVTGVDTGTRGTIYFDGVYTSRY